MLNKILLFYLNNRLQKVNYHFLKNKLVQRCKNFKNLKGVLSTTKLENTGLEYKILYNGIWILHSPISQTQYTTGTSLFIS